MDGWLKVLVAATSIAVLAAVGYFFYGGYTDTVRAREQSAARIEQAATDLERQSCQEAYDRGFRPAEANCRKYGFR